MASIYNGLKENSRTISKHYISSLVISKTASDIFFGRLPIEMIVSAGCVVKQTRTDRVDFQKSILLTGGGTFK